MRWSELIAEQVEAVYGTSIDPVVPAQTAAPPVQVRVFCNVLSRICFSVAWAHFWSFLGLCFRRSRLSSWWMAASSRRQ